ISVMVGATRSRRVASVTRPFSMGTLRSTRSSTRLPFTSTSSRVRKLLDIDVLELTAVIPGRCEASNPESRDSGSGPSDHPGMTAHNANARHVAGHDEITYSSFPIATAVSAMRLEKPHSLSYQDITRTSVPFCTLVWSSWNVDEWGSWLKSIETF